MVERLKACDLEDSGKWTSLTESIKTKLYKSIIDRKDIDNDIKKDKSCQKQGKETYMFLLKNRKIGKNKKK